MFCGAGYCIGISAVEHAARFDGIEIGALAVAHLDGASGAFTQNAVEIFPLELKRASAPDTGRNLPGQGMRQFLQRGADLIDRESTSKNADSAVDVVPDSSRRDHAFLRIDCCYAADREPVAL